MTTGLGYRFRLGHNGYGTITSRARRNQGVIVAEGKRVLTHRPAVTVETQVQPKNRMLTVRKDVREALGISGDSGHRLHVLIEPLEGGESLFSGVKETVSGPELYGSKGDDLDSVLEPGSHIRATFTLLDK